MKKWGTPDGDLSKPRPALSTLHRDWTFRKRSVRIQAGSTPKKQRTFRLRCRGGSWHLGPFCRTGSGTAHPSGAARHRGISDRQGANPLAGRCHKTSQSRPESPPPKPFPHLAHQNGVFSAPTASNIWPLLGTPGTWLRPGKSPRETTSPFLSRRRPAISFRRLYFFSNLKQRRPSSKCSFRQLEKLPRASADHHREPQTPPPTFAEKPASCRTLVHPKQIAHAEITVGGASEIACSVRGPPRHVAIIPPYSPFLGLDSAARPFRSSSARRRISPSCILSRTRSNACRTAWGWVFCSRPARFKTVRVAAGASCC